MIPLLLSSGDIYYGFYLTNRKMVGGQQLYGIYLFFHLICIKGLTIFTFVCLHQGHETALYVNKRNHLTRLLKPILNLLMRAPSPLLLFLFFTPFYNKIPSKYTYMHKIPLFSFSASHVFCEISRYYFWLRVELCPCVYIY